MISFSLPQEPGCTRIRRSEDPYTVLAGNDDQPEAEQPSQKLIDGLPWQIDLLLEVAFFDPARPGPHDDPHESVAFGNLGGELPGLNPLVKRVHGVSMRLAGNK